MKYSKLSVAVSAAALSLASVATADDIIEHVIVTGEETASDTTEALKIPELLLDTPQTISVVSAEQIEDQGFQGLDDIIQYTPGATIGQGEGHRDQVTIRGQNTTADFFLDGIRDDVQYFRPLYNLERVEILRGSNALVFGRGGGGGVINRVTKSPVYDEGFNELTAGADSFGAASLNYDGNFVTGEGQAFRLNAFYEALDNHRDEFDGDRFAFNPTYSAQISNDTSILLSYEHVNDDRVVDRGIPSEDITGEPARGFRDTFFGNPGFNETTFEGNVLKAQVEHLISDDWLVNGTVSYADYDKFYANIFPAGFTGVTNQVTLDGYIDTTDRENFFTQVNFVGEVYTGSVEHTLLIGTEFGIQDTANTRRDAEFFDDPLNGVTFLDGTRDQIRFDFSDPLNVPDVEFTTLNRDRDSEVQTQSLFVQDQIDIGDQFVVVAGARYDRFDIDVDVRDSGNPGSFSRVDEEISPRLGAIYKPKENISIYASFSRTFLPRSGDQFLTLTPQNASLEPEEFTNREIGFKWDIQKGFTLSTSLFELERDSGTTQDPNDPGNTILISSIIQGFELQLEGNITDNWYINLGYSNLDAEEDGRVVDGVPSDRTLAQVPENMFSIWNRYNVSDKLAFGAGIIYQSEQFTTISNQVELPDFTRVDAAVYYSLSKSTDLQLNIENLFDEEYFPTAHTDNNITTGAPVNARLSVRHRF